MKLPGILQGIPPVVLVLAVPVIAFVATVGVSLGTNGGSDDGAASGGGGSAPSVQVAVTNKQPLSPQATGGTQPAPSTQQQAIATATPVNANPDRTSCDAIRGTDYRSATEREWFIRNCSGTSGTTTAAANTAAATPRPATSGSTTSGSSVSGTSSGSTAAAGTGATTGTTSTRPATTQAATGATAGVESPTGQKLVIPKAGINTDISITKMTSGSMPDPKGYFNALTYDMSAFAGLGGDANSGNLVLSGHVDCGKCYNGGAGVAVFWSVRDLRAGDSAQVYTADGKVVNYVVASSASYGVDAVDWGGVIASNAADMTIITCTGNFAGGEYDKRHVVQFRKA